jgi:hypothetical protein
MVMHPKRIFRAAVPAVAALVVGGAAAAVPPTCTRHLSIELTPDVPNLRALGFLGALLTPPGSQLAGRGQTGSVIELELTGAARDDQCRAVIAALRKDSSVQTIAVHK